MGQTGKQHNIRLFAEVKMDIMNFDIERFCSAILYGVESGMITGTEAIEMLKDYLWRWL